MTVAALIYAGGHATRIEGRNKAMLRVGGRTLLERVHDALAGCSPILLSIGPREEMAFAPIVPDRQLRDLDGEDRGPIGALAAAVEWLSVNAPPEFLLTVAVDTPFFPDDFAERARAGLGSSNAVIASYNEQLYPTNALWRLAAIADLPARIRAGTAPNAPKKLAREIGLTLVDYTLVTAEDPFLNVNTEADLLLLEARAKL